MNVTKLPDFIGVFD